MHSSEDDKRALDGPAVDSSRTIGTAQPSAGDSNDESILRQNALLAGINKIFEDALKCDSDEELGQTCLRVAEQITGSKFAFIGEVGPDGLFHDLAVSNMGWQECAMQDQSGHRRPPGKVAFRSLYGRVLYGGKPRLTNDPARHPDSKGTPPGHPPLTSFLAVPLIDQGRTVGLIAVANRPEGYLQSEVWQLEALAPSIVEALHRKRAERALRANEARLRLALNAAKAGTWEWNPRTKEVVWSDELWTLYGLERNSREPSYENWLSTLHPEDRETTQQQVWQAVDAGTELSIEYRLQGNNGEVRWLALLGRPVIDGKSGALRYIGIAMDITERKVSEQALIHAMEERRKAELQFSKAQRMEAVARLAGGTAHFLNNQMCVVKLYCESLLDSLTAPELRADVLAIARAGDKASEITQMLLRFARSSSSPNSLCDVAKMLDQASPRLRKQFSRNVYVATRVETQVPPAAVDPTELIEVLMALARNSNDAMPNGGEFTLSVTERGLREDDSEDLGLSPGNYVVITVSDTGTGMDESTRQRVFEPFFTTKGLAKASGLSLAGAWGFLHENGGGISVTSAPGAGTTFQLFLPAVTQAESH